MRNFSTPALILSTQISGENNRRVTVFSPDEGIHFATLYGGPKSKLRSLVSPMNSGVIYLYRDEVKNQTKITDFDVKNYHLSFRENLFKTYAASFATEILIKTKCAGSPKEAWKIINHSEFSARSRRLRSFMGMESHRSFHISCPWPTPEVIHGHGKSAIIPIFLPEAVA